MFRPFKRQPACWPCNYKILLLFRQLCVLDLQQESGQQSHEDGRAEASIDSHGSTGLNGSRGGRGSASGGGAAARNDSGLEDGRLRNDSRESAGHNGRRDDTGAGDGGRQGDRGHNAAAGGAGD
jgi:hypothetical protein